MEKPTDINVSPFVEVFQNASKAGKDAFRNTSKDGRITIVSGLVGKGPERLHNRNKKRTKADGSKGCRDGSNEGIAYTFGAASRLLWSDPLCRREK
jgi:hypothetical protein